MFLKLVIKLTIVLDTTLLYGHRLYYIELTKKLFQTYLYLNVLAQQKPDGTSTLLEGCDSNASGCESKVMSSAFGQVNLSDCGLPERILHRFCSADPDDVCLFDSLKFCDKFYTWS